MESILSKPDIDFKDDFRQAFIVMKYEIMKFMSGKKILIFGIINVAILALIALLIFSFDVNFDDGTGTAVSGFQAGMILILGVSSYLMLFGATLFSSVALVSEFEDRTALMLFTKPIRKGSIFMGKAMAAFLLNAVFVIIYYIVASIVMAIKTGDFSSNVFVSMGYCMCYVFSLTGVALLFSSFMKKGSSASILTFVFLLMVPSIVSVILILALNTEDTSSIWYMFNVASGAITTSIYTAVENGPRDALVMILWGLVPMIAAYFIFRRREV